jgi:prolyl-tRNA synthetase
MRQTQLFSKTRREAPKDEVSKNAQLLIRAGYIHKDMAGVYSMLPLGLRVLNNVVGIIREEMNAIGGQEVHLASLQNPALWEKTDRFDDKKVDNWFKTELKNETTLGLGFTHEEPITNMMRDHIRSFRDLPMSAYQFQTKFRNEARAKSGILRGREFLMKDLYSFSKNAAEHEVFYEKAKQAYLNVFKRVGIGEKTYLTYASGGSFAKYSHEFQTLTDAGEDIIHICERCKIAINDEIVSDQNVCPLCKSSKFRKEKAVEVGNIFSLGTRFSDALSLSYLDEAGKKHSVVMGSYGIGPGRLMGTVVELFADDKGLIWPEAIAPFKVHLVSLGGKDEKVDKYAEALYHNLTDKGIETLFDDRSSPAGEKFADSDLLGIPYRIVVSSKLLDSGKLELKRRGETEARLVPEGEVLAADFLGT